jgi:gluconate 2-dehydrogenase gamma chain
MRAILGMAKTEYYGSDTVLGMDRRVFMLSTAAAAVAPLYAGPLVTFTGDEAKLLEALVDQVIPADESGPGAAQAGVVFYIDKQLNGPLKRFVPNYRRSLPLFHEFLALSFDERTKVLRSLDGPKASFFSTVVDHTMQGFYGSPVHGGNLNEASWKMLGIQNVMGGHNH